MSSPLRSLYEELSTVGYRWFRPMGCHFVLADAAGSRISGILWTTLAWLDVLKTSIFIWLPSTPDRRYEPWLMYSGDLGYCFFGAQKRHHFDLINVASRIYVAAVVTRFHFDSGEWLTRANHIYAELAERTLQPCELSRRMARIVDRSNKWMRLGCASYFIVELVVCSTMMGVLHHRNIAYYPWYALSYVYMMTFGFFYAAIFNYCLAFIYYFVSLQTAMFRILNDQFRASLLIHKHFADRHQSNHILGGMLIRYFQMHSRVRNLAQQFNTGFIHFHYLAYFLSMVMMFVNYYYSVLVSQELNDAIRIGLLGGMFSQSMLLIYLAGKIANVDRQAMDINDHLYRVMVVDGRIHQQTGVVQHEMFRILSYDSECSVRIMGSPVNPTTVIKVLTIFLTLMAFVTHH